MQTSYIEIMQTAERLVQRATEFSTAAEAVTAMLRTHRQDLADTQDTIAARFEQLRVTLTEDEAAYKAKFETLFKELDQAIAAIEGIEPVADKPASGGPAEGGGAGGTPMAAVTAEVPNG